MKTDKSRNIKQGTEASASTILQSIYEGTVNKRVVERVGNLHPNQSKGIVHEVLYADKLNVTHSNLGKTTLTNNKYAVRDDIISVKKGLVTQRAQLKDTISPKGIEKTIAQGTSGKYKGTNLLGTKETTNLYNKHTADIGAQKMSSTGISSKDTQRIADSFSGHKTNVKNIMSNSTRAGAMGAITNVAIGVVDDVINCESGEEVLAHATANGARGFAAGYAGSAAATAATTATAGLAATSTIAASVPVIAVAAPVVAGIGAAAVVSTMVMKATDGEIKDVLEDVGRSVGDVVSSVGDSIEDAICDGLDNLGDAIDNFFDGVSSFLDWF